MCLMGSRCIGGASYHDGCNTENQIQLLFKEPSNNITPSLNHWINLPGDLCVCVAAKKRGYDPCYFVCDYGIPFVYLAHVQASGEVRRIGQRHLRLAHRSARLCGCSALCHGCNSGGLSEPEKDNPVIRRALSDDLSDG